MPESKTPIGRESPSPFCSGLSGFAAIDGNGGWFGVGAGDGRRRMERLGDGLGVRWEGIAHEREGGISSAVIHGSVVALDALRNGAAEFASILWRGDALAFRG